MSLQFLDLAVNSSAILHQRATTLHYSRSLMGWHGNMQSLIKSVLQSIRWIDMKILGHVFSFFYYAGRRFYHDRCFLIASSLTYTSLLSLVPLMTIIFAIFSVFPSFTEVHKELQVFLITTMVPEVGEKVQEYLNSFMNNAIQMTAFGVFGLLVSALWLLSTIENAFQSIWRISEPRSLVIRFLSFWAILTFCPFLFGMSLSLSDIFIARFDLDQFGFLTTVFEGMIQPFTSILECLGFTCLYLLIPNRPIYWGYFIDSVIGGLVAMFVFEVAKGGFAWYVQAFPIYHTIYGVLSTIPIFLVWLYLAWSAILIGAVVAVSLPEWRCGSFSDLQEAPRMALALAILEELLEASRNGIRLNRRMLINRLQVGAILVDGILERLRYTVWVARTYHDTWVLTRDLSCAKLYDLENDISLGSRGTIHDLSGLDPGFKEHFSQIIDQMQSRYRGVLDVTINELLSEIQKKKDLLRT